MKYLYNFLSIKSTIPLEYLNDFYTRYLQLLFFFKILLLVLLLTYSGLYFYLNYFTSIVLCNDSNEEIIIGSSQILKLVALLNIGIGSVNYYFLMDISKIENFTPHNITDYDQIHSLINNMNAMYTAFRVINFFILIHNPGIFYEEEFEYTQKSLNIIVSNIKDIIPRVEEINKITESSRVIDYHHLQFTNGVHPYFRKKSNFIALS